MTPISLNINGNAHTVEVEDRALLADVLRDNLKMTGTHIGCDTSQCGCCTILMNGDAVKSCTVLAVQANGAQITTIEGLAKGPDLHPIQVAFSQCHGLQCGFCTPGMIMATAGLLSNTPQPTDAQIHEGLSGNLCRCTGYIHIVESVKQAAKTLQEMQA
ncbi:(2Fe-2S)-binding protein [Limnohabitans sp. Rim8]|jgi:carbon-monoxide dehydrogenase small subunit|uniref:(2Fe-2S)-binding protein n=1 Tax=Limnohabitans sp. Rim8 TaxID=1100718 RepID=UPI00262CF3F6|nr:(2Fe-2S)-binding protein [Limnohabitans sp. Rim8]